MQSRQPCEHSAHVEETFLRQMCSGTWLRSHGNTGDVASLSHALRTGSRVPGIHISLPQNPHP